MRISDWSSDVCSSDLVAHQSGEQGLAIRSLRQMAGKIERKAVEYSDTPEDRAFIAREMMDMVLHISAKEAAVAASRSEARRVGKECVSTCGYRWSTYHYKKRKQETI